jgi:hypothetical protein
MASWGVLCDLHSLWLLLEAGDMVTQPPWDLGLQDCRVHKWGDLFLPPLELVRPLELAFEIYPS